VPTKEAMISAAKSTHTHTHSHTHTTHLAAGGLDAPVVPHARFEGGDARFRVASALAEGDVALGAASSFSAPAYTSQRRNEALSYHYETHRGDHIPAPSIQLETLVHEIRNAKGRS
jgi:hypothetical protein